MYESELRDEVSQGDIFTDVPFVQADQVRVRTAILLSHDCVYDKPQVEFVLMAWVRPLDDVAPGNRGNIRTGKVKSAFYLPARAPLDESFADLYQLASVRKDSIRELDRDGSRVISLTEGAREALRYRIHLSFSR
jgi:hypothetical protein